MIQIHQSLTNNNKTRQLPDILVAGQDPCDMESEYVGERYLRTHVNNEKG